MDVSVIKKPEEALPAMLTAVGARLMTGKGMPQNKKLAIQIWSYAAESFNYGPAYSCLAEAWYFGDGVRADATHSFMMSAKAVNCGAASRRRTIAEAYEFGQESGWPVERDLPRAATFWASGANNNDLTSLRNFFRLCGDLSVNSASDAEKWAVIDALSLAPQTQSTPNHPEEIGKDLEAIAQRRDPNALNRFLGHCARLWNRGKDDEILHIAKTMGIAASGRPAPRLDARGMCLSQ